MLKTVFVTAQIAAIAVTACATPVAGDSVVPELNIDAVIADARIDEVQLACMGEALYWEGRNQSVNGMNGIAHVIMNRVASPYFPDTVCGVVHQGPRDGSKISKYRCQFTYFCDGKGDSYPVNNNLDEVVAAEKADLVAEDVMYNGTTDTTNGSDHYHASYINAPYWAKYEIKIATIDTHIFYKLH